MRRPGCPHPGVRWGFCAGGFPGRRALLAHVFAERSFAGRVRASFGSAQDRLRPYVSRGDSENCGRNRQSPTLHQNLAKGWANPPKAGQMLRMTESMGRPSFPRSLPECGDFDFQFNQSQNPRPVSQTATQDGEAAVRCGLLHTLRWPSSMDQGIGRHSNSGRRGTRSIHCVFQSRFDWRYIREAAGDTPV